MLLERVNPLIFQKTSLPRIPIVRTPGQLSSAAINSAHANLSFFVVLGNPTLDFQTLDLVVVETEKLHIPVPFRAVPSPKITWHKDGKELKADERVGFRSERFTPSCPKSLN